MSNVVRVLSILIALASLSACAEHPGERVSVRAKLADWIAPPGYQPDGGPVQPVIDLYGQQQAQIVQQAYQTGQVSQVTIYRGQVNVPVGGGLSADRDWRQAGGVVTVAVAECQTVPVQMPRGDGKHGMATVYLSRIGGLIYASQYAAVQGCQMPQYGVQSYPSYGRFPLSVPGVVQDATIQISPLGAAPIYR